MKKQLEEKINLIEGEKKDLEQKNNKLNELNLTLSKKKDLNKETKKKLEEITLELSKSNKNFIESKEELQKVIKETEDLKTLNVELKKQLSKKIMDSTRKNYIIAKFEIKKSDIKQETQILNYNENDKSEELKNSCEIYIKDKKIPFSYTYKFEKEGIYTIKY